MYCPTTGVAWVLGSEEGAKYTVHMNDGRDFMAYRGKPGLNFIEVKPEWLSTESRFVSDQLIRLLGFKILPDKEPEEPEEIQIQRTTPKAIDLILWPVQNLACAEGTVIYGPEPEEIKICLKGDSNPNGQRQLVAYLPSVNRVIPIIPMPEAAMLKDGIRIALQNGPSFTVWFDYDHTISNVERSALREEVVFEIGHLNDLGFLLEENKEKERPVPAPKAEETLAETKTEEDKEWTAVNATIRSVSHVFDGKYGVVLEYRNGMGLQVMKLYGYTRRGYSYPLISESDIRGIKVPVMCDPNGSDYLLVDHIQLPYHTLFLAHNHFPDPDRCNEEVMDTIPLTPTKLTMKENSCIFKMNVFDEVKRQHRVVYCRLIMSTSEANINRERISRWMLSRVHDGKKIEPGCTLIIPGGFSCDMFFDEQMYKQWVSARL